MASALASLANATATFLVAGEGVVTDPRTGNVVPFMEQVSVALFLRAEQMKTVSYSGVSVVNTVYRGYVVETLDPRVVKGTDGVVMFGGKAPEDVMVLSVNVEYGETGLIGPQLVAALGARIELVSKGQTV